MIRGICVKEDAEIVRLIDEEAKRRGIDRSGFIRETLRLRLRALGLINDGKGDEMNGSL